MPWCSIPCRRYLLFSLTQTSVSSVHTTCILRALYQSTSGFFCELDVYSVWGALHELVLSKKNMQSVHLETALQWESNRISWAPFTDLLQQDTPNPNSDADEEVPKVNSWETMSYIFISILHIFRGEKSEYENECVVSATKTCQHMGSCYPWCVINTTNCSSVFLQGFCLMWK